ncbi:MAG: Ig-like domain-containing protein [Thermoleophilia bacterium]
MPRSERTRRAALAAAALAVAFPATLARSPAAPADEPGCAVPYPGGGTPRQDLAPPLLARLNALRARNGLAPLAGILTLQRAALWKSGNMIAGGYFDHADPPTGRSPSARASACGFTGPGAGENIAMGQADPDAVMRTWTNSPGHLANMLDPSYTAVGIGVAQRADGRLYWTQVFGAPSALEPPSLPIPQPDALTVPEDAPAAVVPVLLNDSLPPGDAVRVAEAGAAGLGTAAVGADGTALVYTPGRDRNGTDTVAYTAVGLMGEPVRGELTVRVAARNDAPVARPDTMRLRPAARRAGFRVLANDRDVDGDRLRVVITRGPRLGAARVVSGRIVYTARRARGRLSDALRYAAVDPSGARSAATLRIRRR